MLKVWKTLKSAEQGCSRTRDGNHYSNGCLNIPVHSPHFSKIYTLRMYLLKMYVCVCLRLRVRKHFRQAILGVASWTLGLDIGELRQDISMPVIPLHTVTQPRGDLKMQAHWRPEDKNEAHLIMVLWSDVSHVEDRRPEKCFRLIFQFCFGFFWL